MWPFRRRREPVDDAVTTTVVDYPPSGYSEDRPFVWFEKSPHKLLGAQGVRIRDHGTNVVVEFIDPPERR